MAQGVVRYDPFDELARLQREMNRLFDNSYDAPARGDGRQEGISSQAWAPRVDIAEDANEVVIHADLPGVKESDIDISMTSDTLTLSGERQFADDERKGSYVRVERAYGRFLRTYNIGSPVNQGGRQATLKEGVLTSRLPKSEETRPKKVQVTAA